MIVVVQFTVKDPTVQHGVQGLVGVAEQLLDEPLH